MFRKKNENPQSVAVLKQSLFGSKKELKMEKLIKTTICPIHGSVEKEKE